MKLFAFSVAIFLILVGLGLLAFAVYYKLDLEKKYEKDYHVPKWTSYAMMGVSSFLLLLGFGLGIYSAIGQKSKTKIQPDTNSESVIEQGPESSLAIVPRKTPKTYEINSSVADRIRQSRSDPIPRSLSNSTRKEIVPVNNPTSQSALAIAPRETQRVEFKEKAQNVPKVGQKKRNLDDFNPANKNFIKRKARIFDKNSKEFKNLQKQNIRNTSGNIALKN